MAPLATTAHDPRTAKALQLVAGAGQWLRLTDRETGARFYGIRSSDGQRTYRVTRDGCSCPDRGHRGVVCCHMLAARMVCEAAAAVEGNQARQPRRPAPAAPKSAADEARLAKLAAMIRNE